jgi:hypothetical protein
VSGQRPAAVVDAKVVDSTVVGANVAKSKASN